MGIPGQRETTGNAIVLRIDSLWSFAPFGHPSLTPPARLAEPCLRAALANTGYGVVVGWGGLLFP